METQGKLPEAGRAITAWRRFEVQGEGTPIPWAGVGAISRWLSEQNSKTALVASHLVLLAADTYMRQSDIFQIQGGDVATSEKYGLALTLGVPERGASTKTGVRQGVRPDFKGSEALLQHYKGGRSSGELLFPLSQVAFATWWRKAGEGLRYDPGPPHTLRHVGPSHDVMANYRTWEQVRNRGRWRAPSSCLRYAKSHQLIKAIECLPKDLTVYGEEHLEAMGFRHRDEVPRS